jgi:SAM-dependent methyltransferase
MSAWSFCKATLLNPRSPACCWRHPGQATRLLAGALQNTWLAGWERWPGPGRRSCPVCGWQGRSFRTFLSADEVIPACICPACGSFDRHRHLTLGIRDELARDPGQQPHRLLGFSLSAAMHLVLRREGLPRCFRSDLVVDHDRFAPDFITDLRCVGLASGAFDWILCSHVLEHIADLDACLDEMLRLLRPAGLAWIQVPLEPDLARSRRIEIDPHRAHAHAWQFGNDFPDLLQRPAWAVTEIVAGQTLSAAERARWGIDPAERFWIARKN